METLEGQEREEEEMEEAEEEALCMVPLGEGEEEGSRSQQELMMQSSGGDTSSSSTSGKSSSKPSSWNAPRSTNPKLNRLVKGRLMPAVLQGLKLGRHASSHAYTYTTVVQTQSYYLITMFVTLCFGISA